MRVLDLFAGTGSSTQAFVDRGWVRCRVELDPQHEAEVTGNVASLDVEEVLDVLGGRPDFVWASPPCTSFSLMSCGRHWNTTATGALVPASPTAVDGVRLFAATRALIETLRPQWWLVENPTAVARSTVGSWMYADVPRTAVTYCAYGHEFRKPTDLFGRPPSNWVPRPRCPNGAPCHRSAPAGSRTGIQSPGLNPVERSRVPYELGESLAAAAEGEEDTYEPVQTMLNLVAGANS